MTGEKPQHGWKNSPETGGSRARLVAACVGLALLSAIVLAVVFTSSSSEDNGSGAEAPGECLDAWNGDEVAVGTGSHSAGVHGYESAWVLYMSEEGEPASAEDGACAVVFASPTLDVEPEFAVTIETEKGWLPLYASRNVPAARRYFGGQSPVSRARIGELQEEALTATNAALLPDGTLATP
jgi:hypothetical protein